ncbi:AcrR family transcriptional regulator [Streptomyces sp. V4I8]
MSPALIEKPIGFQHCKPIGFRMQVQAERRTAWAGSARRGGARASSARRSIAEFAIAGYDGTTTAAIARRVGVTQPYLFRLFPDKKAIFVAALTRSMEDTRLAFQRAADGVEDGERARQAMTDTYAQLISTHPETHLMQMQGYAVVAADEAQGDDLIC